MTSFKEIKKLEKLKPLEGKMKRLYGCEYLSEEDNDFLTFQFDLYRTRKSFSPVAGTSAAGLTYLALFNSQITLTVKAVFSLGAGFYVYKKMKEKNRFHFERLIFPYFEKYRIK